MKSIKLPPELEAKRDELAEEHEFVRGDGTLDDYVYGFNDGHQETLTYLASRGDAEFDEQAAREYMKVERGFLATEFIFILGARWQHEQSKLKYEARIQQQQALIELHEQTKSKLLDDIEYQKKVIEKLREQRDEADVSFETLKRWDKEIAELEQGEK